MFSFFKKEVPKTNETREIDVVQTWEVRWESRYGSYSGNTKPELEVFTSLIEAELFLESLKKAAKLLKYTEFYTIAKLSKRS